MKSARLKAGDLTLLMEIKILTRNTPEKTVDTNTHSGDDKRMFTLKHANLIRRMCVLPLWHRTQWPVFHLKT